MDSTDELKRQHDLLALHRYYLWANRFRLLFEGALPQSAGVTFTPDTAFDDDAVMFTAFWYSELYTVIEGWQKIGLNDLGIDEMLESRHVTLLRRYRNGVSRFRRESGDPQFLGMLGDQEIVPWARELTRLFGKFFDEELAADPS